MLPPKLKAALREAFPHTIPILLGYVFMGMVFGILLQKEGFGALWAFAMAVCIYGGTTQFVAVGLMASGAGLWESFILASMINARQIFYTISMLARLKPMGKKRWYMLHALTDETFALLNLAKPSENPAGRPKVERQDFDFFIALLNHGYWIAGCTLGALLGSALVFNHQGLDFVMSAIFVVIFIEQWRTRSMRAPALIGVAVSLMCLLLCGAEGFLLPSLVGICIALTLFQKPLSAKEEAQ